MDLMAYKQRICHWVDGHLNFICCYKPKEGQVFVEDVLFPIALMRAKYWNDARGAQVPLFFIYYINPIILLTGLISHNVKIIMDGYEFKNYGPNITMTQLFCIGALVMVITRRAKSEGLRIFYIMSNCPYVSIDHPKLLVHHTLHNRVMYVWILFTTIFWMLLFGCTLTMQRFSKDIESVLPYYYWIDLTNSPWRFVVEVSHMFQAMCVVILIGAILISFFSFTCYLEYHCDEIIEKLDALKCEWNLALRHRNFANIVQHHMFVIKYWTTVCDMFKGPFFGLIVFGSVILGLTFISLIIEFRLFYFGSATLSVLMALLGGHIIARLEKKSVMLQDAAFYAIPWDGDIAMAKNLLFMRLYTNQIFSITLGNTTKLTNKHLIEIAKTVYSCIAFYVNLNKAK